MNVRGLGAIRFKDVIGQVDENTKLVALASCHFISGYRMDFDAIGAALRERRILFCLDAIQTLGAFPTSSKNADMLAADAHKWLLGPCGAGVMYVRREVQERVSPPIYGWNNVKCPNYVAQEQIVFRNTAQKYEVGTQNFLGLVGLVAAMKLILEIGVENIAHELMRKRFWLVEKLRAKGYEVVHADATPETSSGIVSFFRAGQDPTPLHQKLLDAKVVTSLRGSRGGKKYIRMSPHFYNTDAELEKAMELL
jgi:cysteine desulfurase / selenocysteine lyase